MKPDSAYRLEALEAETSLRMKGRPGAVSCDQCDYVDYPAWVEMHRRSSHPATKVGHCMECGGYGTMVVTAHGLYHRYGTQCDDEQNARHEERLLRAIEDGPEF